MPLTESPGAGRLVDVGDTRLHMVERSLEGPPLICLHGGPGFDHWSFGDYLDPLASDLRLILVDQRGHGMSEEADPATLTVADLAEDVFALAEALELERFALLGHSFGGGVALRAAVERPDSVDALVLVGTPTVSVPRSDDPSRLEGATQEELRAVFEESAPALFAEADEAARKWLRQTAPMVFSAPAVAAFHRNGTEFGVEGRLGAVRASTLVVAGRHDRLGPVEASEALASNIPGATLVVMERSGHVPYVEEQEAFLDAVRSFLV